ncbi:nucleoside-diphosphate sugar epimerase/dehydratase [Actinomyces bovis]|uniref:nucleoside-diphosphate sugar epimerase/dehydratase n=1 Tax=Actinomyces bovis TaxID=1658 RepID=UPI0038993ECD
MASVLASCVTSGILAVFFEGGFSLREYGTAWAVTLILVAGSRMTIRAVLGGRSLKLLLTDEGRGRPRTLIVGAGQTGSLTIKRMLSGDKDIVGNPVGVVDDDPAKVGQRVHGVKVKGNCQSQHVMGSRGNQVVQGKIGAAEPSKHGQGSRPAPQDLSNPGRKDARASPYDQDPS